MEIALARAIGTHPIAAYLSGLALVLAAIAVSWFAIGHAKRSVGRKVPARHPLLRAVIGFAVILALGSLFAEMSEAEDVRESMGRFDVTLTDTLRQQVSAATLLPFALATRLGDVGTIAGLCVAVALWLWWRGDRPLARLWVIAVAGNAVLNEALKSVFERARPIHEHALVTAPGWSFPSGHSSGAIVAYGMLAYVLASHAPRAWRLPLVLAAAGVAFTTGLSRAMLHVHWASDVLAGFASGLMWLTVCVLSADWMRSRQPRSAD